MSRDCNDDLINYTFKEINNTLKEGESFIPKDLVKDVINEGQFKFVKNTIEKGMFEDVGLKYFGKFKAMHKKIKTLYNNNKTKKIISYGGKQKT